MAPYPYRQPDEPALDYHERVARLAEADEEYQTALREDQAEKRLKAMGVLA